jgi:prephenate dehydrogenase
MSDFTVTIVGTGVIGTSLGLALKQFEEAPRVLGHDRELTIAKAAAKTGAFDKVEWNLVNACEQADLIILAIPFSGIRQTLEAIVPYLKENVVISDTSRSKVPVLAWAEELLPDHAHFVGGDPLVSPAGSGHKHANADLFQNRHYCLVSSPKADEDAMRLMIDVVNIIGAQPFFLDAAEHDGLTTGAAYLPAALSVALVSALARQGSWREIRKMGGSLFEQTSAGAVGESDALRAEFLNNRNSLVRWLDTYGEQLSRLRTLIAETEDTDEFDEDDALFQMLDKALVERHNWLIDYEQGRFIYPEMKPTKIERPSFLKRMVGFGR